MTQPIATSDLDVPATSNDPSLSDIACREYVPFDAETLIIHPIIDEETNDDKFYKELGEKIIDALLNFHAWAAARPRHEHNLICEQINSKMAKIEETEKDQETNRQRIANFVQTMKNAVLSLSPVARAV